MICPWYFSRIPNDGHHRPSPTDHGTRFSSISINMILEDCWNMLKPSISILPFDHGTCEIFKQHSEDFSVLIQQDGGHLPGRTGVCAWLQWWPWAIWTRDASRRSWARCIKIRICKFGGAWGPRNPQDPPKKMAKEHRVSVTAGDLYRLALYYSHKSI